MSCDMKLDQFLRVKNIEDEIVMTWVIDRYIYLSHFSVTPAGREHATRLQVINRDESFDIFFFLPPELLDYSSP